MRATVALLVVQVVAGTWLASCRPEGSGSDGDAADAGLPDASFEMALVPEGSFMMGCNEAVDADCDPDEFPYHEVWLSSYEIDRTEVTNAAYALCVGAGACTVPAGFALSSCEWRPGERPDHPVGGVGLEQARAYCEWMGKRLPTEAEWEKAARGTDGRKFPWGNGSPDCTLAIMRDCESPVSCDVATGRVASRPAGASPYGVLDMAGNVNEWVSDYYGPYELGPVTDPTGPPGPGWSIYRGGNEKQISPVALRVSYRMALGTNEGGNLATGFRCVRPAG